MRSRGTVRPRAVDGKFFVAGGFYAFVRPFEMGFQCLHDVGKCGIVMVWGGGGGGEGGTATVRAFKVIQ